MGARWDKFCLVLSKKMVPGTGPKKALRIRNRISVLILVLIVLSLLVISAVKQGVYYGDAEDYAVKVLKVDKTKIIQAKFLSNSTKIHATYISDGVTKETTFDLHGHSFVP